MFSSYRVLGLGSQGNDLRVLGQRFFSLTMVLVFTWTLMGNNWVPALVILKIEKFLHVVAIKQFFLVHSPPINN